jgi:hypothetical protein
MRGLFRCTNVFAGQRARDVYALDGNAVTVGVEARNGKRSAQEGSSGRKQFFFEKRTKKLLLLEPVSKVAPTSRLAWFCEHRSGAGFLPVSTGAEENRVIWPSE